METPVWHEARGTATTCSGGLGGSDQRSERRLARLGAWGCRALLLILLALVGTWVVERTTWYLAIDQFGYLTFARDLAAGRIFHRWEVDGLLSPLLPQGVESDVLAQTYVRRDGLLYCRYAPGFPLLLAAAVPFGEAAVRSLNVIALLALVGCLYGVGRHVLGTEWQGLVGALLACLLPTYLLLWSISPLRDVPTHLFAFAALWTLVAGPRPLTVRRAFAAAALLGFAVSIRVDAALYLVAASSVAWLERPWPVKRLAGGAAGLMLGLLPILSYNWMATGNPLRPTQFMEAQELMSRPDVGESAPWLEWLPPWSESAHAAPSGGDEDVATRARLLQGGGLKLRHLQTILPANLEILRGVFGDLGLALIALGALAAVRRRVLFAFTVPYAVTATLFFSLWTRPEPRYLAGVVLMGVLLLVAGATALATAPARRSAMGFAVALVAATFVLLLGGAPVPAMESSLPLVTAALQGSVVAALVVAVVVGRLQARRTLAVGLTLTLVGVLAWRSAGSLGFQARFQQPEVERARMALGALLDHPAVVITRSDIGRPAENINYYTDANAVYEQEILRWGVDGIAFLNAAVRHGFATYFLMPPHEIDRWRTNPRFRRWFKPELIAQIPPQRAVEFFVASPTHRGVPLQLFRVRLKPGLEG